RSGGWGRRGRGLAGTALGRRSAWAVADEDGLAFTLGLGIRGTVSGDELALLVNGWFGGLGTATVASTYRDDRVADWDGRPLLDQQGLDHTGERRRQFDQRFGRLNLDDDVVDLDRVA